MAEADDSRPAGATRSGPQRDMTKLVEQRTRAAARVDELEAQARLATQTRAAAQEALTEFERRGDGAADRPRPLPRN